MTISVEDETAVEIPGVDLYETAEKVAAAALDYEGCPYEAEIGILITDNPRIREMNRDHRHVDRETDVLSFPMLEFDSASDFSKFETGGADCFDPESGELILGDIVISAEKVIEQAGKYGHSNEREYAFLIAHSMLHLMGYDHEVPDEAAVMEEKQKTILSSLGINR